MGAFFALIVKLKAHPLKVNTEPASSLERSTHTDIDLVGVEVSQFGDGIAVAFSTEHLMQADMAVADFEQCFELLGTYKQSEVV